MTLRLLPSICQSPQPRILCITSSLHHLGIFDLAHFDCGPGMQGSDYINNKLYYQMWLTELQARFLRTKEYMHITVNGVNPGFVASSIWHPIRERKEGFARKLLDFILTYGAISTEQGALALVYAAVSDEFGPNPKTQGIGDVRGRGGGLYINRIWEQPAKAWCSDADARLGVWKQVDEELGLTKKGLLLGLGP